MKMAGEGEGTSRRKKLLIGAAAVVVAAVYYFISRQLGHIDLQGLLEDVSNTLGAWTYLLVGFFAFAETGAFIGLVVPGETTMLIGGAVAGQGAVDIYLLIAIAWFAAWLGDTTSFFLGRRLGREFVLKHGARVGISHERFEKVEAYFDRHGGKTIFIGRWISLVRALAPFIAGSSGMGYRAFVPYSVLGTGLWASLHILVGYFFSRSIDQAAKYAGRGALLLGTLIVVTVGIVLAVRYLRVPENRRRLVGELESRGATRWLVMLGRRLRPPLAFVWARLTPGGAFGLEFTSVLAVLAVGSFVVTAYAVVFSTDPGPTAMDSTAADIAESIRTGWLTSVAKLVSQLGSSAVVLPLAAAAAVALAVGRRWAELAVLVAGMTIAVAGFHELKAITDRPRPADGLVSAHGSSYPSGHAAYSTFYVWAAVTVAMRLRRGMARASLLIGVAVALAGLIGLSRVYLGVHYLSDVSGGWGLGAAAFSLCAAVALIVSRFRQNPARAAGA
ncbi:MAG TPA: bifunctional DedA family/phosphatase PAP2 family protein [Solirubrobacterales bacterium]